MGHTYDSYCGVTKRLFHQRTTLPLLAPLDDAPSCLAVPSVIRWLPTATTKCLHLPQSAA